MEQVEFGQEPAPVDPSAYGCAAGCLLPAGIVLVLIVWGPLSFAATAGDMPFLNALILVGLAMCVAAICLAWHWAGLMDKARAQRPR